MVTCKMVKCRFKKSQFDRVSKKHLVKSVKNTKKKLIIIWMNNITPKMIPVRAEMLENTLWKQMKKIYSS